MNALLVAAALSLLQITPFNSLWQFFKGEEQPAEEAQWRTLDLPHDWGVEGPFDIDADGSTGKLPWMGTAWYRKSLEVSAEDLQGEVFLDFGGVMSGAEVFCNGQPVCRRPYGYSSFRAVLTPFLKEGSNLIAVKVVNPDDSSRWYPGGGIYRNVYLVKAPKAGFAQYGVSVTAGSAAVFVKTSFRGDSSGALEATLSLDGKVIGTQTIEDVKVADGESKEFGFFIKNPNKWSPESPVLYDLEVKVTTPLGSETVLLGFTDTALGSLAGLLVLGSLGLGLGFFLFSLGFGYATGILTGSSLGSSFLAGQLGSTLFGSLGFSTPLGLSLSTGFLTCDLLGYQTVNLCIQRCVFLLLLGDGVLNGLLLLLKSVHHVLLLGLFTL